jgi:hypothetical protein
MKFNTLEIGDWIEFISNCDDKRFPGEICRVIELNPNKNASEGAVVITDRSGKETRHGWVLAHMTSTWARLIDSPKPEPPPRNYNRLRFIIHD